MEKSRRNYNVFFNLHTVSGIAISVGIFVCFFAGAYALFLNEIDIWQYNTKIADTHVIDYDRVLHIAKEEGYQLTGRKSIAIKQLKKTGEITIGSGRLKVDSLQVNGAMSPKDSLAHAAIYLRINPTTYEINSRERPKYDSHLGTFLYHLHFFEQIPTAGIFLSGFVSLFLVFSIFTGIIVHWKKIRSNFFTFRLKSSVKNFWTDGHTALGIIGIPYQLMYGVTGVFLGGTVIFAYLPTILVLEGNTQELGQLIYPKNESPQPTESEVLDGTFYINPLVERTVSTLDASEIGSIDVNLSNYGKTDAAVKVSIIMDEQSYFSGKTNTKYRLADGEVIAHKPIQEDSFAYYPRLLLKKIHYATFGGYFMKVIYFLMALLTCYVVLSGVMIWLVAREKKTYAHKAKFNRNVGAIFIGSCMGLYPAIALFFCLVKMFPDNFGQMSTIFFLFWLGYTVYAFFIKSPYRINKHALLLAGILGLLVPIFNGLQSGLWFWKSLQMGYPNSFFVDVSWLVMASISLWVGLKVKRFVTHKYQKKQNASQKALENA